MVEWITNTMEGLGYWGIALLMFLENVFPPIPSELIMPLAGFVAGQGRLSFWGVVVAGLLGSVIGQLPLYYVGRYVGEVRLKRWADRYGHWFTVGADDIDRAKGWFERHGGVAVLLCRLVPGVRSLISIPAGMARMPLPSFLLYSTVGMGIWTTVLAFLGRLLGQNYGAVEQYLGPATYIVLGTLAVVAVVWVLRRKRQQAAGAR